MGGVHCGGVMFARTRNTGLGTGERRASRLVVCCQWILLAALLAALLCICLRIRSEIGLAGIDAVRLVCESESGSEIVSSDNPEVVGPLVEAIAAGSPHTESDIPTSPVTRIELLDGEVLRYSVLLSGFVFELDGAQYVGDDRLIEAVETLRTGLVVECTSQKTLYSHGDTIGLTVRVTNRGDGPITIPAKGECRVQWWVPYASGDWYGLSDSVLTVPASAGDALVLARNETGVINIDVPSDAFDAGRVRLAVTGLKLDRASSGTMSVPESVIVVRIE